MIHDLKIWPVHFENILNGSKTFELRKTDRDYRVGDELILRKYDPDKSTYTGDSCRVYVPYILYGKDAKFGLPEGFCILSIKVIDRCLTSKLSSNVKTDFTF